MNRKNLLKFQYFIRLKPFKIPHILPIKINRKHSFILLLILIIIDLQILKLVNCIWDLEPNHKPNKHDPTQSPFKRLCRQRKQGHCITIFLPPKGENIMGANSHW